MGMLLVNSNNSYFKLTNLLYKKLRNLEVNTLKKFTAITVSDQQRPLDGVSPRELLLLNECDDLELRNLYFLNFLKNQSDLALVISDYYKPLITQFDGTNSGVAVSGLANTSSVFTNSKFSFNFAKFGYIPTGGLSHLLARCPWNLGEFLALTNRTVSGQSILYCGLAKRWISPEAFPFMEVTSEHKLEVSEKDGRDLISEHFLSPPKEWNMQKYVSVISEVFNEESIFKIRQKLEYLRINSKQFETFATETLNRLNDCDPLASELTLNLIKRAKKSLQESQNQFKEEVGSDTYQKLTRNPRLMQETVFRPALIESLKDEVRVASRLIGTDALRESLYGHITGQPVEREESGRTDGIGKFFESLGDDDYRYCERSDFPLSAHPKLRKFHPDFNPQTGLDHDPEFMAKEVHRWSGKFMENELNRIRANVTGMTQDEVKNRKDIQWN